MAMAYLPWPAIALPGGKHLPHPLTQSADWKELDTELALRRVASRPGLFVAAARWHEAGKIDYALRGKLPVLCLCRDPRAYGVLTRPETHLGQDALIIGRKLPYERVRTTYGGYFESIEELPPIVLTGAGGQPLELSVYLGHRLRASAEMPSLLDPLSLGNRRR